MITEEPPAPDIRPVTVRNVPSEALVTRLSAQVDELEGALRRLRRRLAIERGLVGVLLLAGAATWGLPHLMPGAWVLTVNGKPVLAMQDRRALEGLLAEAKERSAPSARAVLSKLEIRRTDPSQAELVDPATAGQRLREALELFADRGVIYVDGKPAVALPAEAEARELLEQMKQHGTPPVDSVQDAPAFKQEVEVRTEPAPRELWATPEEAAARLEGRVGEGTHTVRSGDTGWTIAQDAGITLEELRRRNPGVNLERLRLGQSLEVGKPSGPVLTVVATGEVTEVIPTPFRTVTSPRPLMWAGKRVRKQAGTPGKERITYRVTFENGKAVRRDIREREVVQPARDQIIAVGTKPRS